MFEIFLTKVIINRLRHLQGIDIFLSDNARKHLILTGKNGSGKSTILNEIKNHIMVETLNWKPNTQAIQEAYQQYTLMMNSAVSNMRGGMTNTSPNGVVVENIYDNSNVYSDNFQKQYYQSEQMLQFLNDYAGEGQKRSEAYFHNQSFLHYAFSSGGFITSYYDAKRSTYVGTPSGIIPMRFKSSYSVGTNIGKNFLQYIVNLKAEQSFANDENDLYTRNRINDWFLNFQSQLRFIFDNQNLHLRFDRKAFNFYINIDNRDNFDFNNMSEGFSAVLSIVTDLLLKSDQKDIGQYCGVVFIDEIETHLHIDLQKKILPFLTGLFPKVQFILTTHSPFVLNSISETVIYDVERRTRYEDFSTFSSEGIIEGYFRQDKYSELIKNKVERFEELSNKVDPSQEDKEEIKFLREYFDQIPKFYSKELELKIEQIKLSALV